jgi:hypothetical protein
VWYCVPCAVATLAAACSTIRYLPGADVRMYLLERLLQKEKLAGHTLHLMTII